MPKIQMFSTFYSTLLPPTEKNSVFSPSAFSSLSSRCRFQRIGREELRIRRETKRATMLTKVEKKLGAFSWAESPRENITTYEEAIWGEFIVNYQIDLFNVLWKLQVKIGIPFQSLWTAELDFSWCNSVQRLGHVGLREVFRLPVFHLEKILHF